MRGFGFLALCCAVVVFACAASAGVAADSSCDSSGTVDVLPLHGEIGVHHEVDLILLAHFELNRLVPHSLVFHVAAPKGTHDFPGGDDTLGAQFVAGSVGAYTARASWKLYGCSDRTMVADAQSAVVPFKVFHQRRPAARFKATIVPGRSSSRAPVFAVDAVCPPSTIRVTQPLSLTVYWVVGTGQPGHSSPHSSVVLPTGCGGKPAGRPHSKSYKWGVVRGATIGVLPGNSVRVLGEVKSGNTIVGATRVRFEPRGAREALLRDAGACVGGCVKRVFLY